MASRQNVAKGAPQVEETAEQQRFHEFNYPFEGGTTQQQQQRSTLGDESGSQEKGGVQEIGSRFDERRDIGGKPITPGDASHIQRSEMRSGKDTGKGSYAARVQAAAAININEGVVDEGADRSATRS